MPFVLAEVENRARTLDLSERIERIVRAQVSFFAAELVSADCNLRRLHSNISKASQTTWRVTA